MKEIHPAHLLKRLTALIIDLCVLFLIGYILNILLEKPILALGNYKILIGILISTLYFTGFHSALGKGQTLGKRIFGFQVIKLDGNYLSLGEAFLRSIIFTVPYCLSDLLSINSENSIGVFEFLRHTIIPGSLFINHFMVFANPLQQCYYDQLLGCIVSSNSGKIVDLTFSNKWLKFIPVIFIISIVAIELIRLEPFSEENRRDLNQLAEIKSKLSLERDLHFSKLYFNYPKNDPYQKTLKLDCYLTDENADIASEVYLITEELEPFKHEYELKKITLSVVRDFNLGIYSSWEVLKKNEKPMKFNL